MVKLKMISSKGREVKLEFETGYLEKSPKPVNSWVYFIRAENTSLVKIGYTSSCPMKRLSNLQVGSPHVLILAHKIAVVDAEDAERIIHNDLKQYRVRGEWFDVDEEYLLEYIDIFKEFRMSDYI